MGVWCCGSPLLKLIGKNGGKKILLSYWSNYYLTNMFCRLLHTGLVMRKKTVSSPAVLLVGDFRVSLLRNIKIWCETQSLQRSFCCISWAFFSCPKSILAAVFRLQNINRQNWNLLRGLWSTHHSIFFILFQPLTSLSGMVCLYSSIGSTITNPVKYIMYEK